MNPFKSHKSLILSMAFNVALASLIHTHAYSCIKYMQKTV